MCFNVLFDSEMNVYGNGRRDSWLVSLDDMTIYHEVYT